MKNNRLLWLAVLGLLSAGGYYALSCIHNWGVQFPLYFIVFTLIFIVYLAGYGLAVKTALPGMVWQIIFFAAIFYLLLVQTTPSLSDDIYHYLWEGKTQTAGYNPFAVPPNAPALEPYRDAVYAKLSSNTTTALYPPLAQLFFRASAAMVYSITFFKCSLFLFFLGACWVLVRLLEAYGLNRNLVLLFAWNPLVMVETAGSGHFDILCVFLVLAALYAVQRKWPAWSMVLLAGAVLVKYYPIVFLPFFLQKMEKKKIPALLVFVVAIGILYLPYVSAGSGLWESLHTYYSHWCFNSWPYYEFMKTFNSRTWYIAISVTITCLTGIQLWRKNVPLVKVVFILTVLMVFLSPVLYPWYLVWLLPLCLFVRGLPFVLFALMVNVSYSVLPQYLRAGVWRENISVMLAQFGLMGIVCLVYYGKDILSCWPWIIRSDQQN